MGANENADDYLAAEAYQGHAGAGEHAPGMTAFAHANGQHYFAWVDGGGKVLMRSEGYASKSARDNGVKSVVAARGMAERFAVVQADGHYYAVLKAGNRQEIARSVACESEAAARALFAAQRTAPVPQAVGKLRVTQMRSVYGQLQNIAASVKGLGLRRRHQSVLVADTRENRGMINVATHVLKVEQA